MPKQIQARFIGIRAINADSRFEKGVLYPLDHLLDDLEIPFNLPSGCGLDDGLWVGGRAIGAEKTADGQYPWVHVEAGQGRFRMVFEAHV